VENRQMVWFQFSNSRTVHNLAFCPVGFPSFRNSIFRLPHVSVISLYCTAVHGPVTWVSFILTPIFTSTTL